MNPHFFTAPFYFGFPVTPMRAASPPRQIESENEMIVISHRLFLLGRRLSVPWAHLGSIRVRSIFQSLRAGFDRDHR